MGWATSNPSPGSTLSKAKTAKSHNYIFSSAGITPSGVPSPSRTQMIPPQPTSLRDIQERCESEHNGVV